MSKHEGRGQDHGWENPRDSGENCPKLVRTPGHLTDS